MSIYKYVKVYPNYIKIIGKNKSKKWCNAMARSVSRTCRNLLRNIWIELWIYSSDQKEINYKEIDEINKSGENAIYYYQQIIDYIVKEYKKEEEKKYEDFITIITIKSNIARLYSKLIFLKDVKKRVDSLKKSLSLFREVYKFLIEINYFKKYSFYYIYKKRCNIIWFIWYFHTRQNSLSIFQGNLLQRDIFLYIANYPHAGRQALGPSFQQSLKNFQNFLHIFSHLWDIQDIHVFFC